MYQLEARVIPRCPGFFFFTSRHKSGNEEAKKNWRAHAEHLLVQRKGPENFYKWYDSRVGVVQRAVSFKAGK